MQSLCSRLYVATFLFFLSSTAFAFESGIYAVVNETTLEVEEATFLSAPREQAGKFFVFLPDPSVISGCVGKPKYQPATKTFKCRSIAPGNYVYETNNHSFNVVSGTIGPHSEPLKILSFTAYVEVPSLGAGNSSYAVEVAKNPLRRCPITIPSGIGTERRVNTTCNLQVIAGEVVEVKLIGKDVGITLVPVLEFDVVYEVK